jgi:hypothetical protein
VGRHTKNRHLKASKRSLHKKTHSYSTSHPKSFAGDPLHEFLSQAEDDGTRLAILARKLRYQSFDKPSFRDGLIAKLKRITFPQPSEGRYDVSFYDYLEKRSAVALLLRDSTIEALWNCLLLKKIVDEDRKLDRERQAVTGFPLKFHSIVLDRLINHRDQLVSLMSKYSVNDSSLDDFLDHVNLVGMRQLRILASSRFVGSRKELLRGRVNEDLAAKLAIYKLLRNLYSRDNLSNLFLRQLTGLILAQSNARTLASDGSLQKALARGY